MFKNISTLHLEGAVFDSKAELNLFPTNTNNTIIYGRNGTGKSTIAKAFRKLTDEPVTSLTNVQLCDKDGKTINIENEDKKRIFVFDEDYINKNVKLKEDALDTIVILGEVVELEDEINTIQKQYDEIHKAYMKQEEILSEYKNNNSKSVTRYKNDIKAILKKNGGWVDRYKKIDTNSQRVTVKNKFYDFMESNTSKNEYDLISDYNEQMNILNEVRKQKDTPIIKQVPEIERTYIMFDDTNIIKLLTEQIERPTLSTRDTKIIELLESISSDKLHEKLSFFSNEENKICKYCYQPIENEHRTKLVQYIQEMLNEVVETHITKLKESIIDIITLDLDEYKQLKNYNECIELYTQLNESIKIYNDNIQKKISNPYTPVKIEKTNIKTLSEQLNEKLKSLENDRKQHNEPQEYIKRLQQQLNEINNNIAYYELKITYENMEKSKQEAEEENNKLDELGKQQKDIETRLKDLQERRSNIKIATDKINEYLAYIFFDTNRLKIEYHDNKDNSNQYSGTYKILSHGKSVKPSDISIGERNIIALSYFFTSVFKNQTVEETVKNDYLFIIDDPISSYDRENRIGILSFLKYMLTTFLKHSNNTKFLIMTHDLKAFYNIYSTFNMIKKMYSQDKIQFKVYEIDKNSIKEFKPQARNEYSTLIQIIYEYALDKEHTNDYEIVIGNIMRQALEAFSTFLYKKDIAGMCQDENILNLLDDEKYIKIYKNLMYRLVLHGGSHKEEDIKTDNMDFYSNISTQEKKRTAQYILCLIYLLNKEHLISHICSKEVSRQDVVSTFNDWLDNLFITK